MWYFSPVTKSEVLWLILILSGGGATHMQTAKKVRLLQLIVNSNEDHCGVCDLRAAILQESSAI